MKHLLITRPWPAYVLAARLVLLGEGGNPKAAVLAYGPLLTGKRGKPSTWYAQEIVAADAYSKEIETCLTM